MSGKRRPAFDPAAQTALALGTQFPDPSDDMLLHVERRIASAVAQIMAEDPRPRVELAAGVSSILGAKVSKAMMDGYAAESRPTHNISFGRFLALVALTRRFDVLDALLAEIGAKIVVGEQLVALEVGLLAADIARKGRRQTNLVRLLATVETGGAQ